MNEEQRLAAIEALDALSEHPMAINFTEPFQPAGEDESDYFEKITNPQDISSIKTRLREDQYQTIQSWLKDVDLIWSNAELFYGPDALMSTVADGCRSTFRKYRRRVDVLSMSTWCREVDRLKNRLTNLLGLPPPRVKQQSTSSTTTHGPRASPAPFSERELQSFVQASEMMTREEDQMEILKIIRENQAEIDSGEAELVLDVTRLNLQTMHALRDFMKPALEKRQLRYPE
jgi:hypothetical protein